MKFEHFLGTDICDEVGKIKEIMKKTGFEQYE